MRTRYYKLVMGVAGVLLRHASRVCPTFNQNPSIESAVKGLYNAKYYGTTVAPGVSVSDIGERRAYDKFVTFSERAFRPIN